MKILELIGTKELAIAIALITISSVLLILLITPHLRGETPNCNYTRIIGRDKDGINLMGTDGNTYVICKDDYLNVIRAPNTTVYYHSKGKKRIIDMYIIPDVTFLHNVICNR